MLVPAKLAWRGATPYSAEFDDVYHSAAGGPAQARHVFLGGNGLPARWRGRRAFAVLETGFGLGVNFLATLAAWRADPERCERLHFVSIERFPLGKEDLISAHRRYPEFAAEAARLAECWPPLLPGVHRVELEGGRVTLTLLFGDVAGVRELALAADAFYLDGFAPAKNPEMWAPQVLRHLGRVAARGATLATWSVAAPVRAALETSGWKVEKRAGFGGKREMLCGILARPPRRAPLAEASPSRERRALVVGAGVAGAAVAERLCARGWHATLVERRAAPAEEASGNPAGAFHPVVSPDDSVFARLTRAAYLHLSARWPALEGLRWQRCGVLQLARDDGEAASQQRAIAALAPPAEYAQWLDAARASAAAGVPLAAGGAWFPGSGWVSPKSLVAALLARCASNLEARFGSEVRSIEFSGEEWKANLEGKQPVSAPVLVLANAADAARLAPLPALRLRRVRGQLTLVPAIEGLRTVLLRGGMALPEIDGSSVIGASYDLSDEDASPRADSHAGNLERLEALVPGAASGLDPARLEGRVGFRAAAPDRLPLAGPLADARGPRLYGAFAYGSRGLLWAGLAAELIAARLEGEPLPLERKLAAALDPGRFALRAARRPTITA
ncbi:MAG TPA: bifunctional tRNA (5-methylaminomethyl-2-thiouridine)(34)-methyltransferase MnmD/FAD-dependent 5-carboxymethylaminomethyl-2-thiouridine(34) oxidoreductase MnmC [Burkholderiales bacterium]|nr:bifunctional tRNA (5-methylaminomethyl-2-thiouridine)(34)-methyltransferase MnmD/FAD-dependent 5-carboxymethylaminomethyl-2-thiouridine(34) oxidoreductase MnmC [Burkholderiales bacterium]